MEAGYTNLSQGDLTVEKGSICVNGVSLTCFNSGNNNSAHHTVYLRKYWI
ncbi:MAG: hypothetical protein QM734_17475 [Cyclobacteriaceae bacterium]